MGITLIGFVLSCSLFFNALLLVVIYACFDSDTVQVEIDEIKLLPPAKRFSGTGLDYFKILYVDGMFADGMKYGFIPMTEFKNKGRFFRICDHIEKHGIKMPIGFRLKSEHIRNSEHWEK